jgi:hypothetical protein
MLVVNAAYRIDSAFQQTISNLCPNTYYEISCWMRNICSKCGCDSNGVGASGGAGYIPTAPADSSGVYPNLTFEVDGRDYYTTGNLRYTGQWVKKGFTYLTGPTQNSFTLKFFNNASGGGGNDWALDDITVATCLPNMRYSPSINPSVCSGNSLTIHDTIRSFFNNYVHYKWQRSVNNGSTWTDVTAPLGPATPYINGPDWEYITSYTIPPTATNPADSADLYRVIVATTPTNLNNANCRSTDPSTIITLNVISCGIPLTTTFLSVSGKVTNKKATIRWVTNLEEGPVYYDVEKSMDGNSYTIIGTVNGFLHPGAVQNNYTFTDPVDITSKASYRIKMRNPDNNSTYSRTVQLAGELSGFAFLSVVNPFQNELVFDVNSKQEGAAQAELVDQWGKTVKRKTFEIREGVNPLIFDNTGLLPAGVYVLRLEFGGTVINKKVVRQGK